MEVTTPSFEDSDVEYSHTATHSLNFSDGVINKRRSLSNTSNRIFPTSPSLKSHSQTSQLEEIDDDDSYSVDFFRSQLFGGALKRLRWYNYLFPDFITGIARDELVQKLSMLDQYSSESDDSDESSSWDLRNKLSSLSILTPDQVWIIKLVRKVVSCIFVGSLVTLTVIATNVNTHCSTWLAMQSRFAYNPSIAENLNNSSYSTAFVPPLEPVEAYPHIAESLYHQQKVCSSNEYTDDIPGILCDLSDVSYQMSDFVGKYKEDRPFVQLCTPDLMDQMKLGTRVPFGTEATPNGLSEKEVDLHFQEGEKIESFYPFGEDYLPGGKVQDAPPSFEEHPSLDVRSTLLNHHWDVFLGCAPKQLKVQQRLMWRVEMSMKYCRATYFTMTFDQLRPSSPFDSVYTVSYDMNNVFGVAEHLSKCHQVVIIVCAVMGAMSFLILVPTVFIFYKNVVKWLFRRKRSNPKDFNSLFLRFKSLSPAANNGILSNSNVIAEVVAGTLFVIVFIASTILLLIPTISLMECPTVTENLRRWYKDKGDRIVDIPTKSISIAKWLYHGEDFSGAERQALIILNCLGSGRLYAILLIPCGLWIVKIMFSTPIWISRLFMTMVIGGMRPLIYVLSTLVVIYFGMAVYCVNSYAYVWQFSSIWISLRSLVGATLEIYEPDLEEIYLVDRNMHGLLIFTKVFKVFLTILMLPFFFQIMLETMSHATNNDVRDEFVAKISKSAKVKKTTGAHKDEMELIQRVLRED